MIAFSRSLDYFSRRHGEKTGSSLCLRASMVHIVLMARAESGGTVLSGTRAIRPQSTWCALPARIVPCVHCSPSP